MNGRGEGLARTRDSAMRLGIVMFGALVLTGCSITEPEPLPVLATIAGYNADDPFVTVTVTGTTATVTVRTYGSGCSSMGDTDVQVNGLEALVVPYDYEPGCTNRVLFQFQHTAAVEFDTTGSAVIRVRGLDGRTVSQLHPMPDTVVVERTVDLQ